LLKSSKITTKTYVKHNIRSEAARLVMSIEVTDRVLARQYMTKMTIALPKVENTKIIV
jgi:hypothetical protein